ncbi:hypothetical protein NJBCHELONAE_50000 [Mycobacteroides chelonae]|nr:hypothetical protein NJBCHELONAE_50000 [Mycobacteroides chelonae]
MNSAHAECAADVSERARMCFASVTGFGGQERSDPDEAAPLPQQSVDEGRGLEWGQIVGALPQAN